MKQMKKSNPGWKLLSMSMAGLLAVGMGFAAPTFAGPGIQINPKVFRPHFNIPSARPTIPCSNLVFQGVRMIGTDFFNPGRNANRYNIRLMTSVLNSGNATYNPKPLDGVIVSGRDMGPRSNRKRIPRLSVNQRARVDITAVIQGRLAPRNPLSVWLSSSTNECSHRNNTFIVRLRQLRAGFLTARRRAEATRRPVIVAVHPASSSGTAANRRICSNLEPVSFVIANRSLVPAAALGPGQRVNMYRLRLDGTVRNSRDTYSGTLGRITIARSTSGARGVTISSVPVYNLSHGRQKTIHILTQPISIVAPNMPAYTMSIENTQRGDNACNALHARRQAVLTISRQTVRSVLIRHE